MEIDVLDRLPRALSARRRHGASGPMVPRPPSNRGSAPLDALVMQLMTDTVAAAPVVTGANIAINGGQYMQ